jgi:hypothetical protein
LRGYCQEVGTVDGDDADTGSCSPRTHGETSFGRVKGSLVYKGDDQTFFTHTEDLSTAAMRAPEKERTIAVLFSLTFGRSLVSLKRLLGSQGPKNRNWIDSVTGPCRTLQLHYS